MIAQIETSRRQAPQPQGFGKARYRAALYAVLAQALSAPRRALCDAVEQGILPVLIEDALGYFPAKYLGTRTSSFLEKLNSPSGVIFSDALMAEYTRLFALNLHCPQYEADYVSRSSFNWSHVISSVTGMYSNFGVQLASGVGERPDHIAVELDFMNLLATKEAHARKLNQAANVKVCRRAQKLFIASHLSRWGVIFARKLREETRLDFYLGVAALMEEFISAEAKYWGAELRTSSCEVDPVAAEASACGCPEGSQPVGSLTQITQQPQTPVQHASGGKE
jgi:putative dimethyl sulfoxide reductase chaperone